MTSTTLEKPPAKPPAAPLPARRPGRLPTVIVLIVALVLAGVMRSVATSRQDSINKIRGSVRARSTLGSMDSFALALLLGGLRGPLVMFLWPAIENQKIDHNLEDIDTMIEWVRLLQPEFDSVHMFQIWNKAYNLSAMMANPANKYTVIMEALDYAASVDRERPGDMNILGAISNVYSGKFGSTGLPEFPFYSRQFREESMSDAHRQAKYPEDIDLYSRLDKWSPLLDDNDNVRPEFLAPTSPRPENLPASSEWNDGSQLQYLKQFEPFPYGVAPMAMAYNYAKRAQVAQSVEEQKPLQFSEMVIDSQPAVILKLWEEDEQKRGRNYEERANNLAHVPWNAELNRTIDQLKALDLDAAMYYYQNASHITRVARAEYHRHLNNPEYTMRLATYQSHLAEMDVQDELNQADLDYLAARQAAGSERKRLYEKALALYQASLIKLERITLDYFMEDEALWPKDNHVMPPMTRPGDKLAVYKLPDSQVSEVYERAMHAARALPLGLQGHRSERLGGEPNIARCRDRINFISDELKR